MAALSDGHWSAGGGRTTLPQVTGFLLGVGFLINGLVGFTITGVDDFASTTGHHLFGFNVNPLHNLVHLSIGVIGLLTCWRLSSSRFYGWLLLLGYGSVLVYGLLTLGETELNFLALNAADNVLHGLSALIGLLIGVWPVGGLGTDERPRTAGRHRQVA